MYIKYKIVKKFRKEKKKEIVNFCFGIHIIKRKWSNGRFPSGETKQNQFYSFIASCSASMWKTNKQRRATCCRSD